MSATFNINAIISAVDRASGTFKRVGENAESLGDKLGRIGRMADVAAGFIVASLAQRALGAVQTFVQESMDAFLAQETAIIGLRTQVRNLGESWDEVKDRMIKKAQELQQTTVYGDELIIEAMQRLMTYGMSTAEVIEYIGAVADLAAAKNIDLKTAADLVGRAYAGYTDTLSRYGIVLEEASNRTLTLRDRLEMLAEQQGKARLLTEDQLDALEKLGLQLSDVERATVVWKDAVQLLSDAVSEGRVSVEELHRFIEKYSVGLDSAKEKGEKFEAVMRLINERFGGAAQAQLEGWSGKLKLVENRIGDLMELIGEALVPTHYYWLKFQEGIVGTVYGILKLHEAFPFVFGRIWDSISELGGRVLDFLTDVLGRLTVGFDSLRSSVSTSLDILLISARRWVNNLSSSMVKGIETIAKQTSKVLSGLKGWFESAFSSITEIIDTWASLAIHRISTFSDKISFIFQITLEGVKNTVADWATLLSSIIEDFVSSILAAFEYLKNRVWALWGGISSALWSFYERAIVPIQNAVWSFVSSVLSAFESLRQRLTGGSVWPDLMNELVEQTREGLGRVMREFEGFAPTVLTTFSTHRLTGPSFSFSSPLVVVQGSADRSTAELAAELIYERLRRLTRL